MRGGDQILGDMSPIKSSFFFDLPYYICFDLVCWSGVVDILYLFLSFYLSLYLSIYLVLFLVSWLVSTSRTDISLIYISINFFVVFIYYNYQSFQFVCWSGGWYPLFLSFYLSLYLSIYLVLFLVSWLVSTSRTDISLIYISINFFVVFIYYNYQSFQFVCWSGGWYTLFLSFYLFGWYRLLERIYH